MHTSRIFFKVIRQIPHSFGEPFLRPNVLRITSLAKTTTTFSAAFNNSAERVTNRRISSSSLLSPSLDSQSRTYFRKMNSEPDNSPVNKSMSDLSNLSNLSSLTKKSNDPLLFRLDNITKSEQDVREYRGLQLENGLKTLLISDPKTDVSAAALAVQVGHMSDPEDLQGLAHFCEHMLFLGTEKYPHENGYTMYLSQSGGSSNAATYPLTTKYHFHVAPDKLDGALDRFAQFFIAPLFTPSAMEREINAVHSEHEKNLSSDIWRIRQVHRHLAKSGHAYNKFGSGNKHTLVEIPKSKNIDVREELLKFHKEWYSANIMTLAVLGKESLDELEEMVINKFAEIENKNVEIPSWPREPYHPERYGQKLLIVPIKDLRSLTISFTTDDLTGLYESAPENYLAHLIGHEGKGSILSELRKLGWCNDLVAGHQNTLKGFGFFEIIVNLTIEGLKHVDDIVTIIFQYLKLLREATPQYWIFEECCNLNEMRFRFKDKDQPESLVTHVVTSMQLYPLPKVLTAPYLSNEWRPELITQLLDELRPEKCRLIVVSQSFDSIATEVEPVYKTKYKTLDIELETIKRWQDCTLNPNFALPSANAFIPSNFELVPFDADITKHPVIIMDTPLIRVWHKQDDQFLKPKACLNFDMSNPIAYLDPLNGCLNQLMLSLLQDQLNEYLYDAELAGLKLLLHTKPSGIDVAIRGYSDKQLVLLEKLLTHLFNFEIDEQRFNILKDDYTRILKNFKTEKPYQHAIYYLALILTENAWSNSELLDAIPLVTYNRMVNYGKEFFQRLHTECFIYGNVNKAQALRIAGLVNERLENTNAKVLPLLARQMLKKREYKLCSGDSYLFEKENEFHKSSCVQLYFQCGPQTDHTNIMVNLIAQIMSEPCYDCLRTKEQLGYIVLNGVRRVNGATGIRILVQSAKPTTYVEGRILNFLESFLNLVEEMPLDEFERHKESLIVKKSEKPKTLLGQCMHFYGEIQLAQFHFERDEAEIAILRKITKEELVESVKQYFDREGRERRVLAVHILSTIEGAVEHVEEEDTPADEQNAAVVAVKPHIPITDLVAFKSSKELYPLLLPVLDIRAKGARSKL